MNDLYSIDLYADPMHEAIIEKNKAVVFKIIKQAQKFPAADAERFFLDTLIEAAQHGFAKAVRALIPLCDPTQHNSVALRWAAMEGHADCVKLLIPVSNPCDENSHALSLAAEAGHTDCVKMLIKVSNPKADNSWALKTAAEGGHVECVRLLIGVSDATDNNSEALVRALKNGFWEVAEVVYPHSDLQAALIGMQEWGGDDHKTAWLEDKIYEVAQQQRAVLNTAVTGTGRTRPKGKI